MKLCTGCKQEKSEDRFSKKADARDGLYPYCKECRKSGDAAYRLRNLDRLRQHDRARYQAPERKAASNAAAKKVYDRDKPLAIAKMKAYAAANPEIVRRAKKAYKVRNPSKVLAATRKRQTQKLNAMPKWANEFYIEEIYDLARRRSKLFGFKWHVDHTVPLQNKLVCGLHCESNLDVIPASVNIKKHNHSWPDMPV